MKSGLCLLCSAAFICMMVEARADDGTPVDPAAADTVRIGLALSGGAALGFAHIGVLKVLEREQIPVWCISGNSQGSLVGGVYAARNRIAEMESIAIHADWDRLFSGSVPFGAQYLPERQQNQRYIIRFRHRKLVPSFPNGLIPLQNVEFLLMDLLARIEYDTDFDFDRLPIPYRAVAVNLSTGDLRTFRSGPLRQAIRASIAIPGVFAPEMIDDDEFVDGGVQQYLPVAPLLDHQPDIIIASLTMKKNPETGISLIDVISRTLDVINPQDLRDQKSLADVVIEPNVDPFRHSDFGRARELIAAGEAAAETALPEIRRVIAGRPIARHSRVTEARSQPMIRRIMIEGLHTTKASLVLKHMTTRPDQRLDFSVLYEDMIRLFNSGLFTEINYRLEPVAPDSVDVVVETMEQDYGFYYAGIRYDNADDIGIGIEVGQANLAGSGAAVRTALTIGDPDELRLGLTGTDLFMFPVGYRLDGFLGTVNRSYWVGGHRIGYYDMEYAGSVADIGYSIGRNAFVNFGFTAARYGYSALPDRPFFDSFPDPERAVGPSFILEFNNFNNVSFPQSGINYRLSAFYSAPELGATGRYARISYHDELVHPLPGRLQFRDRFDCDYSMGEPVLADYLTTGGGDFIGLRPDELTTDKRLLYRIELGYRLFDLFGVRKYPVYIRAIANAGLFDVPSEPTDFDSWADLIRIGAGIGMRTDTPLGPVTLDVGWADLNPRCEDRIRLAVYLSIGREFRYTR